MVVIFIILFVIVVVTIIIIIITIGRGESPSPRPVVYLQHCLTCSSAIWVFGKLKSSSENSIAITIIISSSIIVHQALLKSLWLTSWLTLATMCGWETVGGTLIRGEHLSLSLTSSSLSSSSQIKGTTRHWSLAPLTDARTSGLESILTKVDFWMSPRWSHDD